jgi:membrane protease YdiL (CAAX protease family)
MQRVKLGRVIAFLCLTFGLSWGFEGLVARTITQAAYLQTGLNPLGMFFPAFSALFLQMFIFKDSPIYFRTYKDSTRWVFYSFFIVMILNGGITLLALTTPIRPMILQGISAIFVMLWTFVLFYLYGKNGAYSFERAGLQLGNRDLSVRLIAGVAAFFLLQAALNWIFRLGSFPGIQETVGGVPVPRGLYPIALVIFFFISFIGTPLTALAALFGEEYGWRGFLQNELVKINPRLGVLLVGLIWGVWHIPIILSGVHTYPPTLVGILLGMVFFVLTGFVFSYEVMKTKSIWTVAFMHGVMNSIYAFGLNYLIRPTNKLFSFGLGIYGLICLALIVLFIQRDPVWRRRPESEKPGTV